MRSMVFALLFTITVTPAIAEDKEDLQKLLIDFISKAASDPQAHQRFWAEDLVYTSSNGKRFGKSEIMQGMQTPPTEPVTTSYAAEEIDIRLLGDAAIAAFKLSANDSSKGEQSYYLNTGMFVKRDGEWRALAWQATRIPPTE
ncbi:nuclear transport factor 2 family protein [Microbulbifer sp. MKSA007]|nr:nuclear transport factor 2 family protein [Microbulbifer sp. MKSA007]